MPTQGPIQPSPPVKLPGQHAGRPGRPTYTAYNYLQEKFWYAFSDPFSEIGDRIPITRVFSNPGLGLLKWVPKLIGLTPPPYVYISQIEGYPSALGGLSDALEDFAFRRDPKGAADKIILQLVEYGPGQVDLGGTSWWMWPAYKKDP